MYSNRLPVRFDMVEPANWLPDVYRAQMPRINVQANQQHLPILDHVIRELIRCWQAKATEGPVSTFAYNLFSFNFYSNQHADQVFQEAFDYALFSISRDGGRSRPEDVVVRCVKEYAVISIALCTTLYPELFDQISQQAETEILTILHQWNQIRPALDQFFGGAPTNHQQTPQNPYRQQPRSGQFGGGGMQEDLLARPGARSQHQANPGYSRGPSAVTRHVLEDDRPVADHVARRVSQEQAAAPAKTQVQATASRSSVGRSSNDIVEVQQPAPMSSRDHSRSSGLATPVEEPPLEEQFEEVVDEGDDDQAWLGEITFSNDMVQEVEQAAAKQSDETATANASLFAVDRVILPIPPIGLDEETLASYYEDNAGKSYTIESFNPEDISRPWDLVKLTNGYFMVPVHLSSFRPTRTASRPMPSYPYDIDTQMKFHLVIPGETLAVTEVILPLEESMRYIDHEFNDAKRQAALARQQERDNVLPDWTMMSKIEPIAAGTLTVERQRLVEEEKTRSKAVEAGEPVEDLSPLQKPMRVAVVPMAHTAEQAIMVADQYRAEYLSATNKSDASVLEIMAETVTPFVVAEDDQVLLLFTKFAKEARPAKALVDALGLYGLQTKDRFYNRVNDIATSIVNAVIEHRLGIVDCRITNFVMDYDPVSDTILEDYGDGTHQRFIGLTDAILSQLTFELGSACPPARLARIDSFDRKAFEEHRGRYIVMSHEYAVLYVNRCLTDLKIYLTNKDRESFAILASSNPDLHAIICGSRKNMKQLNGGKGGTLFVVSRDDRMLQLHQSAWDGNWFTAVPGISLASPVL